MKKSLLVVLCILMFAVTLMLFSPTEISARPWYCFWFPFEDCREIKGQILVTQCDTWECNGWGSEDQICVTCTVPI